jgi:16S rRNA processing protein RimM
MVVMGRIATPYGVHGWVKVQPFTEYVDGLLDYETWWIGRGADWREYRVLEGAPHGQTVLAGLEGVTDRDQAARLKGLEVAVPRDALPESEPGEWYWDDLIGLRVVNLQGDEFGEVTGLLETGASDVLQVAGDRQRLIPFVGHVIAEVNLGEGFIRVDWSADY